MRRIDTSAPRANAHTAAASLEPAGTVKSVRKAQPGQSSIARASNTAAYAGDAPPRFASSDAVVIRRRARAGSAAARASSAVFLNSAAERSWLPPAT